MVAIVDDLIILGIAIAASVAASQVSAHSQESAATDEAGRQKALAKKQQQIDYWIDYAAKAGGNTTGLEAQRRAWGIEKGYEGALRSAEQQADQTRLNGWLNAGSMAAGGLANASMSAASSGAQAGGGLSNAFGGNDSLAERAGQMSLDAGAYGLLQGARLNDTPQPIRQTDPAGGFKLQEQDYRTLGGAGPYAQGPYADDEYATGVGLADPRRFQFRL